MIILGHPLLAVWLSVNQDVVVCVLLMVIKVKYIRFVATHNYLSTISISYSCKNLGQKNIVTIVHCTYNDTVQCILDNIYGSFQKFLVVQNCIKKIRKYLYIYICYLRFWGKFFSTSLVIDTFYIKCCPCTTTQLRDNFLK